MKLKFINLNLWYGGKLFDEIIEFLKKEDPDILSAQEVYNATDEKLPLNYRSVAEIKEKLNFEFTAFSPTFLDHKKDNGIVAEQGNAIFSRFPILSTRTIFYEIPYDPNYVEIGPDFSKTPRNLQHCEIEIKGKILNVFNTQGIWGFDGEDNEARLKMSKTIVREVEGKERVILSGDFNTKEQTETIRNIETRLKNVFKGQFETSFNMKRKSLPGFATSVVDMVFATDDLKIEEHYMPQVDVTDHMPLVVVFDIGD